MKKRHSLDDLDADIRDHLERETQENIERGISPDEAHAARGARRRHRAREGPGELVPLDRDAIQQLDALPGVRSAGIALYTPLSGDTYSAGVTVEGYTLQPNEDLDVSYRSDRRAARPMRTDGRRTARSGRPGGQSRSKVGIS